MFYIKSYTFVFSLLDNIKFIFLTVGIILSTMLIFYYPYEHTAKFNKLLLLLFIPVIYVSFISFSKSFILDVYFIGNRIIKTRSIHFLIVTSINLFYILFSFIIGIIKYLKSKANIRTRESITNENTPPGHPGFTSVGIPASMLRFAALHCYDNVRSHRLPEELRDRNPTGRMWRFIDGEWTLKDIC